MSGSRWNTGVEVEIMKITKKNYKKVLGKILKNIAEKGRTVYFSICYCELDTLSPCYFTPVAPIREGYCLFVDDYEKLLVLLLTHPKVKEIEYDEKEGCIMANFETPKEYWEEEEEVEV